MAIIIMKTNLLMNIVLNMDTMAKAMRKIIRTITDSATLMKNEYIFKLKINSSKYTTSIIFAGSLSIKNDKF